MPEYVMTFDIGTSSLKAALIDRTGRIIAEGGATYQVNQPHPGWAEQDPEEIWEHVCATSQAVLRRSSASPVDVHAAVFVAPWKNIIGVDADGNVVRDSIIWMDYRATEQAARLNATHGSFVGTGQEFWPRLMWMKENEPDLWSRSDHILGLNSFLKFRATGAIGTEPSDDLIRSQNPRLNDYYAAVLESAGLTEDLDKFPPATEATDAVGTLTARAAEGLGLRKGTTVFGGFGDLVAITWGVGRAQLGDAHIYFGTSSWLVSLIEDRFQLDAPQYFSVNSKTEGATFALQTGCLALDWLVDQLYRVERSVLNGDIYSLIGKDVEEVPPGSDGVLATHWLTGELAPLSKNSKGMFINLTTSTDRRHMARAMMESVCFTHRRNLDDYARRTGTRPETIRVVGGGAVSDVWMQILADVLQITVQVPDAPRYTGTLGAFYCAALGLGWIQDLDAVADAVRIQKQYQPNPANRDVYDRNYDTYLKLHDALQDVHTDLNGNY
ncbi:FGGY-family carbohydrate kinase [Rhodococcus sp. NPDC059968]|uniref:xylulokinase n=1 Tax=Rhodococcus sp. NPDC059968 TaxID=3347017 RepID=UPI0036718278